MDNPNQRCASFSFLFEVEIKFLKKVSHRSSHVVYLDQNKRVRVSVCVFFVSVFACAQTHETDCNI